MSRLRSVLNGLAALVVTLVLVVGVPVGLTIWVGWPLPTSLPTLAEVELALRSGIDPQLVINTLAVIVWLHWLQLAATLTAEIIAVAKGRTARLLPVLPGIQQTAARLVATITLIGASLAPVKPPPALALETATATVEYNMPAPGVTEQPPANLPEDKAPLVSYTTRLRDTLWGIAERSLGDGKRWQEIRRLNPDQVTADGSVTSGIELLLPADATRPPADPDQVTVESGDHFWSIAESALTDAWGRTPTEEEIYPYWRLVVNANWDRLAPPGDPDLIYPGQVFALPPTPDDPQKKQFEPAEGESGAVDSQVTVRPGDHFWSIAETALALAWARQPTNTEIIPYWGRLVEANRDQLVNRDNPSLILPGQTLRLPPVPDDPTATASDASADIPEGKKPTRPSETSEPETQGPPTKPPGTAPPTTEPSAPTPSPAVEDTQPESEVTEPETAADDILANEEDEGGGLLPVAVPIAGLGIIAAGLVALVDRLRRRQLQHRPPETIPTPPPDTARPVEAGLRAAAALEGVELVDVALRALGRQIVDNHLPAPNVVGAHLSDHYLKLLLWTPQADPPDGWTAEDDGAIWSLPVATDLTHLQLLADGTPAPWPTLVTAGHNPDGQLLVDVEFAGAIAVTGSPEDVLAACRTIAVELAASPFADHLEVVCVGFGADFADLERLTVVDQVDDRLLDTLEATTSRLTNLEDGVLHARLAPGGDTTYPTIIIDPSQTPPVGADRLLAAAQTGRGVAAVVGYATGDRWQLHFTDGTVRVAPLGFTLDRRDLTPTEHQGITGLVEAAKNQDGIPSETVEPVASSPNGHNPDDQTGEPEQPEPEVEPVVVEEETEDLEVRVLGSIRIDGPVGHFDSRKAAELPVYLALHRDGAEADTIMEALWPGEAPDVNRFNRTTSRARTPLGEASNCEPYLPRFDGNLYRVSPLLGCDLDRFTNHVQKAAHAHRAADKIAHLREALELVEGRPFSGAGNGYTWAWSEGLVSHAIVTVDNTAHELSQIALAEGDTGLASWAARKGLLSTTRCEECYRNLMRAAIDEGNQTALEAIFTELTTVIDADDGPDADSYLDPETVDLYERHSRRTASPDSKHR